MQVSFKLLLIVAMLVVFAPARSVRAQAAPILPDTLLDFGTVPFPLTEHRDLRIVNAGDANLSVLNVYTSSLKFTFDPYMLTVAPGDTETVVVAYAPVTIGPPDSATANIIVYTGGVTLDTLAVAMRGQGIQNSPILSVSVDSLYVVMPLYGTAEPVIEITNTGGQTLDWQVEEVPPVDWMCVDEWQFPGTVTSIMRGETSYLSVPINIKCDYINNNDMWIGAYDVALHLTSNGQPASLDIPVHVDVVPLRVTPEQVSFGHVFVGYSASTTVSVLNRGISELHITDIVPDRGEYSVDATAFTLAPGGSPQHSRKIEVTVTPTAPGPVDGTLTFYSNAPAYSVTLVAEAVTDPPPVIDVDTDTIRVTLQTGDQTTRRFAVGNSGGFPLYWGATAKRVLSDSLQVAAWWLTVTPPSDTVAVGGSDSVTVEFDPSGGGTGVYIGDIIIASNDPLTPLVIVPTLLDVVDSVATGTRGNRLPDATALHQNHPNPFNPVTTIAYDLRDAAYTTIDVFGVDGARVRTLVSRRMPAGRYTTEWDGENERGARVASGVYFYRMVAGDFTQTRKMVILK